MRDHDHDHAAASEWASFALMRPRVPLHELVEVPGWDAWVQTRPPTIQKAIARFPPMTELHIRTKTGATERWFLLGWSEQRASDEVSLIFSVVDPSEDYNTAQQPANRRYLCAHHLEEAEELI
jgi:hypothetical protein